MSLTDDAKLVVETIGTMRQAPGPLSVLPDGYDEACLRLATAYIEAGRVEGGGCPLCGAERVWQVSNSENGVTLDRFECGTKRVCDNAPEPTTICKDRQIAILTARLAAVTSERHALQEHISQVESDRNRMACELAEHKRRLLEQSATLNSVRQSRDEYKRLLLNLPERRGWE